MIDEKKIEVGVVFTIDRLFSFVRKYSLSIKVTTIVLLGENKIILGFLSCLHVQRYKFTTTYSTLQLSPKPSDPNSTVERVSCHLIFGFIIVLSQ